MIQARRHHLNDMEHGTKLTTVLFALSAMSQGSLVTSVRHLQLCTSVGLSGLWVYCVAQDSRQDGTLHHQIFCPWLCLVAIDFTPTPFLWRCRR